tara:strand:- start:177 stop:515 length:339 start_codon:yes stop_codon:yes gene_type:complete
MIDSTQELSEIIQSSNLNLLLGAGVSCPFLPVLGTIEKELNDAKDDNAKAKAYKTYFKEVMLPNKKIVSNEFTKDYETIQKSYQNFFQELSKLLLIKGSPISRLSENENFMI